jgi:hypothetical protein
MLTWLYSVVIDNTREDSDIQTRPYLKCWISNRFQVNFIFIQNVDSMYGGTQLKPKKEI